MYLSTFSNSGAICTQLFLINVKSYVEMVNQMATNSVML